MRGDEESMFAMKARRDGRGHRQVVNYARNHPGHAALTGVTGHECSEASAGTCRVSPACPCSGIDSGLGALEDQVRWRDCRFTARRRLGNGLRRSPGLLAAPWGGADIRGDESCRSGAGFDA